LEGDVRSFWNKKSEKEDGKLAGPKEIPEPLQNYLLVEKKLAPDWVKLLRVLYRFTKRLIGRVSPLALLFLLHEIDNYR